MARRIRGEGSVTQRSDGRWQASLQIEGKRRTVYAKTEREARARLLELRQKAASSGAMPDTTRRTFSSLIDAWLTSAPNLRATTKASYRNFLNLYVLPTLGGTRLERITPDRLQRLYTTLKPSVAEKIHRILHRAFAVAVLWRWLPDNPCDRVMRPAYRPAERRLWNREEAQTFLTETANHWLGPLWTLLMTTGLRLGEALALTWDEVGLGVAVNVAGTLHHVDGEAVIGEPKTRSALRTVMLPPIAIDALQRQRAQQLEWRFKAGERWASTSLVFTGETGKALFRCTPESALRRECVRLGLPPMTPHGLRHLHASLLLEANVPLPAVSARLGHANPQITLRLYAHALPGQDRLAAEAIGRALVHDASKIGG
jgi:integrase